MKRISVFLSDTQIMTLKARAQASGLCMAEMLRRLLDEALNTAETREQRYQKNGRKGGSHET